MNEISWPLMINNIEREDLDLLIEHLKQDDPKLTHGPKVEEFEKKWSEWLGVEYSLMVNSGSSANDLTMLALRELHGPGEIIVPALTWVSDIASVLHAGHKPVFVDISIEHLGIDTKKILSAVNQNTRAVFITHVLGYNALTEELINELAKLRIPLIEDVCESHGATHNNKKLGSIGYASNFSFYYAHHMTTIEGGMVSTNDAKFYDILRMLRSHGMVRESKDLNTKSAYIEKYPDLNKDFIFAHYSHNMRPNELNGILGLSQLKRLDKNNILRTENLLLFLENLDSKFFINDFKSVGSSNYAFTIVLKDKNFELRNKIEHALSEKGIEFRRGLSGGGNQLRQPYLRKMEIYPDPTSLPNTEHIHHFSWYVGNYPGLDKSNILLLTKLLNEVAQKFAN